MTFLSLAKKRYSVRSFNQQMVEKEKLLAVLEAARIAPSAANFQPWHFVVVNDKEKLNNLYRVYHGEWIQDAPVIIVACSDRSQSWKRGSDGKDSSDIDISIAIDHMTLMAADLGLGTCWVCNFKADLCSEILDFPHYVEPIALLPLGYPKGEAPNIKKRKPMEEIVHLNSFGKPMR